MEGQAPLHLAALWGHDAVAQILIEHRADVNVKNNFGATALHWAAEYGTAAIAELLLDAGADPNAGDSGGRTPLHVAAENSHVGVVMVLLTAGADTDLPSHTGQRAIDLAPAAVAVGRAPPPLPPVTRAMLSDRIHCSRLTGGDGPFRRCWSSGATTIRFTSGCPRTDWSSETAHHDARCLARLCPKASIHSAGSHWSCGLFRFVGIFKTHGIDFEVLKQLDEAHLKEIGIPLGGQTASDLSPSCPNALNLCLNRFSA